MNICIVIPTLKKGGAERVAVSLANYLVKKDHNVLIITFDNNKPEYNLDSSVILQNVFVGNKFRFINFSTRIYLIRKKLAEFKTDITLSFFMKTTMYTILTKQKKTKNIGLERSNPYYNSKNIVFRILEKVVLPLADGFIFLTEDAKYYYSKKIQKNSIVIPNGVFIENINPAKLKFNDRNLKEISAVGRLHPVKDYITMIKAFKIFSQQYKGYVLKIYGEGPELKNLSKLVDKLNLNGNIMFMGLVNEIDEYTRKSGMFISSSKSESWGNAIMESLSLGIPTIATDCDFGPREMINHGINGLLVPVGDEIAMADAMKTLVENEVLAEKISLNAYEIRETHKPEIILGQYHNYIFKIFNHGTEAINDD